MCYDKLFEDKLSFVSQQCEDTLTVRYVLQLFAHQAFADQSEEVPKKKNI